MVEVPLDGRDLSLGEAPLSASARECRLALHVSDSARCRWPVLVEELQDKLSSFLIEKDLDQSTGIQVRTQNLSSLM